MFDSGEKGGCSLWDFETGALKATFYSENSIESRAMLAGVGFSSQRASNPAACIFCEAGESLTPRLHYNSRASRGAFL
jgi:hypothetical protein